MKNGMLMVVLAATLLGGCTANRPATSGRYGGSYDDSYGGRYDRRPHNDRNDDRRGGRGRNENDRMEERIERYANELNLSRGQVRDIQKIQDRYERRGLSPAERNDPSAYRRLEQQKRREMLAVLTPAQQSQLRDIRQRDRGYGRR